MPQRHSARPLRVHIFGDPAVELPDGRTVALERRAAALLALAALEPGISRLRVASLLWPDSADPRRNLRQQLLRFRQLVGQALVEGESTLALSDAVLVLPDDLAPTAALLLAGQRYDDCEQFDGWLQAQRDARRARRAHALDEAMARAEAAQRFGDAIVCAQLQLADDPTSEACHRCLIRLHYLNQDGSRARGAFELMQRTLAAELGVRPSAETQALMRLIDQQALQAVAPARVWATALQRPPRLIGRERELAAVRDAWQGGGVVLLLGEAGMGKSRLIAEMAHDRRLALVQGRPGDAGIPYATLARLLRDALPRAMDHIAPEQRRELARVLPELAPTLPLPADGQRLVLQDAVRHVLAAAQLEAIVVDDLHFADEASIEMLLAFAGEGANSPLRWLFAQRPAEGGDATAALHDKLQEAGVLRSVSLAPFDGAAMAELLDSLGLPELDSGRLAAQLVQHTGGNPLYALETLKQALATDVLRHGQLPKPVSVSGLIERRIRQLSERALALARVAAIAGVDFDIALAEEVTGVRAVELASAWGELESAGVLRDEAFAHDLVYDAVLRSIPAPVARRLHGAVAAHLGTHDGVAARVAAHWLAAGAERDAMPWLGRAAQQARTGLRRREELQFLLTLAGIEERLGERGAAFERYKQAHQAQLAVDKGTAGLETIFAALRRLALSPEQAVDIDDLRAADLNNEGRFAEAETLARRALADARRLSYESGCAAVMSTLSMCLSMQGRLQEALLVVEAFWPFVERLADPEPSYFNDRAILLDNLGRPREAIALHQQTHALLLRREQSADALTSLGNLAVSLMECGRMRAAQRTLDRAEAMRRAHDSTDGVGPTGMLQSLAVARALGCYDLALTWAERAQDCLSQAASAYLPLVGLGRAAIWTDLGQLARAQQSLPGIEALNALPPWLVARRWQFAARLRTALGHNALDCVEAAAALLGGDSILSARESVTLQLASQRGSAADLDAIFAVGEAARAGGRDGIALAADLRAAELATALGMHHAAMTHADRGREGLRGDRDSDEAVTAADLSDAEGWLMLARAYTAAGRSTDAADAGDHGVAWVRHVVSQHVPDEFRDSYLHRNAAVRALTLAAGAPAIVRG